MTKLSVNINKLATLRNARGKNTPDVLAMTLDIIYYGAQGITVHPRPDGRHIRTQDVYDIAAAIDVEFNIEGYPDQNFLQLVLDVKPTQCTLVPDLPHALTSNAGWQVSKHIDLLQKTVATLRSHAIRTSLFIDPINITPADIAALYKIQTDRVEFYTETYADAYQTDMMQQILHVYKNTAISITNLGIAINAGHDLNLHNLKYLIQEIPMITEVSIGHALVCDALYLGMRETISQYLACLTSK